MSTTKLKYKAVPFESYDKHQAPGSADAERVSNFFITMSTNVRMTDEEAVEHVEGLQQMSERLFSDQTRLEGIIKYKTYEDDEYLTDDEASWDRDIISSEVISKVEVGHMKQGSRLHLHVGLKIWHKSYISLDRAKMLEDANECLEGIGYPYPIKYLNIKVKQPTTEDYLRINRS